MLREKNGNLQITQGDDHIVELGNVEDLASYNLKIQVRTATLPRGELLFEGRIVQIGDKIVWFIKGEDTENLDVGKYYYDVYVDGERAELDVEMGNHATDPLVFEVKPRVTERGGDNG